MRKPFKPFLFFLIFIVFNNAHLFAQSNYVDSLRRAIDKSKESPQKVAQFQLLAHWYLTQGYEKALIYINKGKALANKIKDDKGLAFMLYEESVHYMNFGKYPKALVLALEAEKISEEKNFIQVKAKLYKHLGLLYTNFAHLEDAIIEYKKALIVHGFLKNTAEEAGILLALGKIFEQKKQYEIARKYFNKSLDIQEDRKDIKAQGILHNHIANIYLKEENISKAEKTLKKLKKLSEQSKYKLLQSLYLNTHATLLLNQGKYESAKSDFETFLDSKTQDSTLYLNAYKGLAKIYKQQQKSNKYAEYTEKANLIQESQLRKLKNKQYISSTLNYKLRLTEERKIQKRTNNKHKITKKGLEISFILLLLIGLFIVALLIFLRYSINRIKVKNNKKLLVQEEQNKKQKETLNIKNNKLQSLLKKSQRYEEKLEDQSQKRRVINLILKYTLKEDDDVNAFLEYVIQSFTKLNFLSSSPGVAIFLKEDKDSLKLTAHKIHHPSIEKICKLIENGKIPKSVSLLAPKSQYIKLKEEYKNHGIITQKKDELAHYFVPIIQNQTVTGVLVVFLKAIHKKRNSEILFFQNITTIMANIITKIQARQKVNTQNKILIDNNQQLKALLQTSAKQASKLEAQSEKRAAINAILRFSLREDEGIDSFFAYAITRFDKIKFMQDALGIAFFLRDEEKTLRLKAHTSNHPEIEHVCRLILQGKFPQKINLLDKKSKYLNFDKDYKAHNIEIAQGLMHYVIPIIQHNEADGFLIIFFNQSHEKRNSEILFFENVTAIMANIITKIESKQKIEEQYHELKASEADLIIHREELRSTNEQLITVLNESERLRAKLTIQTEKRAAINAFLRYSLNEEDDIILFFDFILARFEKINFLHDAYGSAFFMLDNDKNFELKSIKYKHDTIPKICQKIATGQFPKSIPLLDNKPKYLVFNEDYEAENLNIHQGLAHYFIPILQRKTVIGFLLVFMDIRHKKRNSEFLFFENITVILANTISRNRAWQRINIQNEILKENRAEILAQRKTLRENNFQLQVLLEKSEKQAQKLSAQTEKRAAINAVLRFSLDDEEYIEDYFDYVLSRFEKIRFLSDAYGAAFFLINPDDTLELRAQSHRDPQILKVCERIKEEQFPLTIDLIDNKPKYLTFDQDYIDANLIIASKVAHYVIPLLHDKKTIGFLIVFMPGHHKKRNAEMLFFENITVIMANTISKKKDREKIKAQNETLKLNKEELKDKNETLQSLLEKSARQEQTLEIQTEKRTVINDILKYALHEKITTKDFFDYTVNRLADTKFLKNARGSAFFIKGDNQKLAIKGCSYTHTAIETICRLIETGALLDDINLEDRQSKYLTFDKDYAEFDIDVEKGLKHYIIPIVKGDEVSGFLIIFLSANHVKKNSEILFFENITVIISNIINKIEAREAIENHNDILKTQEEELKKNLVKLILTQQDLKENEKELLAQQETLKSKNHDLEFLLLKSERQEEKLEAQSEKRAAINAILRHTLVEEDNPNDFFDYVISRFTKIKFMIDSLGTAIFMKDEADKFVLKACNHNHSIIPTICKYIEEGKIAKDIDFSDYKSKYLKFEKEYANNNIYIAEGLSHYLIPIIQNEIVIGIVIIFFKGEHNKRSSEILFFENITAIIANAITKIKAKKEIKYQNLILKDKEETLKENLNQLMLTKQRLEENKNELEITLAENQSINQALERSANIVLTNAQTEILNVNDEFCHASGYSREELVGKKYKDINPNQMSDEEWQATFLKVSKGETWKGEVRNQAKDGSYYWLSAVINPVFDKNGHVDRLLSIRYDITEKKRNEQKIIKVNRDLTSSLKYAQRIQEVIMLSQEKFKADWPDSFIFFKPRDIVSGDFYFYESQKYKSIIAAIDCTGHGIPGAFMSLVGSGLLHEIVTRKGVTAPNKILDLLKLRVMETLKQKETQNQDGMDIAICSIDRHPKVMEELLGTPKLDFAAAGNPLIFFQDGEMERIKGDKIIIGGYRENHEDKQFMNHVIPLYIDTTIYIFSDGIQDQFGGETKRKFMPKRLRAMLAEIHQKPVEEQHQIIEACVNEWQGSAHQTDDMLLICIKIKAND